MHDSCTKLIKFRLTIPINVKYKTDLISQRNEIFEIQRIHLDIFLPFTNGVGFIMSLSFWEIFNLAKRNQSPDLATYGISRRSKERQ